MSRLKDSEVQFARDQLSSACETMKRLLRGLQGAPESLEEDVHTIRKSGKSLRGGFAMFGLQASSSRDIQAIGRLLSGSRDAVTRLKTWDKLGWNAEPKIAAAIRAMLEQQTHASSLQPPAEALDWCLDRVDAALDGLTRFAADELAQRSAKSLAKLERKFQKRCRGLDHGAPEDFHEARKAVKAWLGAIASLPEDTIPGEAQLTKLAESLGDENDLATLGIWLEKHGFTQRFAPDLWEKIQAARRGIQRKALKQARKLVESAG